MSTEQAESPPNTYQDDTNELPKYDPPPDIHGFEEVPPPVAAFGTAPPDMPQPEQIVVIHVPEHELESANQADVTKVIQVPGEVYEETRSKPPAEVDLEAPSGEGGQVVPMHIVGQPHGYPAAAYRQASMKQVEEFKITTPASFLSLKLRDQRVSTCCWAADCCMSLQLVSNLVMIWILFLSVLQINAYLHNGLWASLGYAIFDLIIVGFYSTAMIVTIVCFLGIYQCKPLWILPELLVLPTHLLLMLLHLIGQSRLDGRLGVALVMGFTFDASVCSWGLWVFWTIYCWAYYAEHAKPKEYDHEMLRPPKRSQIREGGADPGVNVPLQKDNPSMEGPQVQ